MQLACWGFTFLECAHAFSTAAATAMTIKNKGNGVDDGDSGFASLGAADDSGDGAAGLPGTCRSEVLGMGDVRANG